MTLVEAREINPPANQEPLHWRLLTSLEVGDAEAACEIVRLYRLRWRIEEVFRALKSDGMRLEETQMHEAQRLFKLAVVGLATACRTMQLVDARNGSPRPATDVIDAASLSAAEAIARRWRARPNARKTPIRRILWPGWPGSLPDLAAGIATINRLAPRPCGPDGDNSKAWPQVLLSPRPLNISLISESRSRRSRRQEGTTGPESRCDYRLVSPACDKTSALAWTSWWLTPPAFSASGMDARAVTAPGTIRAAASHVLVAVSPRLGCAPKCGVLSRAYEQAARSDDRRVHSRRTGLHSPRTGHLLFDIAKRCRGFSP